MDALPNMFLGLGAGCQQWQRQALESLQVLLLTAETPPGGYWAAPAGGSAGPRRDQATSTPTTSPPSQARGSIAAWHPAALPTSASPPLECASASTAASTSTSALRPAFWRSTSAASAPLASLVAGAARHDSAATPASAPVARGACCSGGCKKKGPQGQGGDEPLRDLSGTWIKNREKSESMEAAMNLMRLNGIVRQAVKLVRGVHVDQDPTTFTFTVFSCIAWFKVKEVYPMSGEHRQFRRRDLRRGKALGWVEPHGKNLHVQLRWNEPLGGQGTDHFRLLNEDELHIESVIEVAGQTAKYTTVYNRKPDRRQGSGADNRPNRHHDEGDMGSDGHHHPQGQNQDPKQR